MKYHLVILPTRGFSEEDLVNFIEIIKGKVYVATSNKKVAIGKYGSKVFPDFSIKEIFLLKETFFDDLIIISDEGFRELLIPEVSAIFARFLHSKKPVILSSLAQIGIAKMELINGRTITFNNIDFPKYIKTIRNLKVNFIDLPCYIDNNLITTKGREFIFDLEDFLID
ncbi:MAG: DJ-1/PfpI family protein, partial [Nanopusillaceae archaeon]